MLQNSSDFYRWLSELEAARSSETEEKFRRYGTALERHLATADGLLASVKQARRRAAGAYAASLAVADRRRSVGVASIHVDGGPAMLLVRCLDAFPRRRRATPLQVLDLFERLREQHRTVATRTSALHSTCERLVAERSRLEELAGAIRAKLAYFDELEAVAAQVGGTRTTGGRVFVPALPASTQVACGQHAFIPAIRWGRNTVTKRCGHHMQHCPELKGCWWHA